MDRKTAPRRRRPGIEGNHGCEHRSRLFRRRGGSQVGFERTNKVVLDFADLEYLSSAGLRVLVATQKRVTAAEGALRIVNASDDIREVFDITGLIDVFDVE